MARVDPRNKTIHAKLVYYGPGMCGKTTNLEYINSRLTKKQLMSLATEGDRTIFFDFMPLDLGTLWGMTISFKLYTVPGQVRYNQTRKMVLKNVDGVVFVADSQRSMLDANLESLDNLYSNLKELGIDHKGVAIALQYNKQDLPNVLSQQELDRALNSAGYPTFLASAMSGQGVTETLKATCTEVLRRLKANMGDGAEAGPRASRPSSSKNKAVAASPPVVPDDKPRSTKSKAAAPTPGSESKPKVAAAEAQPRPAPRRSDVVPSPGAEPVGEAASAARLEEQVVASATDARVAVGGGAQARVEAEPAVATARIASVAGSTSAGGQLAAERSRAAVVPSPGMAEASDRTVPVSGARLDRVLQTMNEQSVADESEKLAKLTAKLDELAVTVRRALDETAKTSEALRREISQLREKDTGSEGASARALRQLGEGIARKADLDALRVEVVSIAGATRELRSAVADRLEMKKVHEALASLAAKPAGAIRVSMPEGIAKKTDLDVLRDELATMPRKADLEALGKAGTSKGVDTSAIEKRLGELSGKQDLVALQKRLDDLPTRQELDALQKRLGELPTKQELDALKGALAGLPTRADLQALAKPAASLPESSALAALQQQLAQLPTKADLATLQDALARVPRTPELEASPKTPPRKSVRAPAEPVAAPKQSAPASAQDAEDTAAPSTEPAEALPAAAPAPTQGTEKASTEPAALEPPAEPTAAAAPKPPAEQPEPAAEPPQAAAAAPPEAVKEAAKEAAEGAAAPKAPTDQPEAKAASAGDGGKPDLSNDPEHQNAARAARVMVSDLLLYHKEEVDNGIKNGDFLERNKDALSDMRATYEARIPKHVRDHKDYLQEAIEGFIAKRRTRLGLD